MNAKVIAKWQTGWNIHYKWFRLRLNIANADAINRKKYFKYLKNIKLREK